MQAANLGVGAGEEGSPRSTPGLCDSSPGSDWAPPRAFPAAPPVPPPRGSRSDRARGRVAAAGESGARVRPPLLKRLRSLGLQSPLRRVGAEPRSRAAADGRDPVRAGPPLGEAAGGEEEAPEPGPRLSLSPGARLPSTGR
ncbi:hypothetical protein scyTo_0003400 [Scyliorhinus torazame]|uniref:Uncharacterized protein n=1 Tax=Scyliorhinus torazame TaxID=75743 RepID=A0A401PMK5_SCYTO|nr:hypothetical protein [Scyliorhinus torazame]